MAALIASFHKPRTVQAARPGNTRLRASFDGLSTEVPVEILPERRHELSFVNDIVPIFTRADCANSNCHGSVRGQKGFKLSLFGSDPELDLRCDHEKLRRTSHRPHESCQ